MAYLGRGLDKISNIEVLDNITFDGSSSYSITKGSVAFTPNSAQSCLISIDGVVQATNFTVSSSTIDFGVAIPSTSVCNFFLHYGTGVMTVPSDGSVSLAKLSATGTKDATTFLRGDNTFNAPPNTGITVADVWRYTASTAGPSGDITSNLERADDASSGILGSGMSESSGIFSFPSTGIYMLSMTVGFNFANEADNSANVQAYVTINNSDYDSVAFACAGSNSTSNFSRFTVPAQALIDVTNTSNVKVKFTAASFDSGSYLEGSTTHNDTSFMFVRLGDT